MLVYDKQNLRPKQYDTDDFHSATPLRSGSITTTCIVIFLQLLFYEFLLFHFNFYYDLIKKLLFECVISCEKSTYWFQILKFLKCQKILKNKKIHCLENFETIYIYIYIYIHNREIQKKNRLSLKEYIIHGITVEIC